MTESEWADRSSQSRCDGHDMDGVVGVTWVMWWPRHGSCDGHDIAAVVVTT